MSCGILREALASMSSQEMQYKIRNTLKGGNETFVLPKSDWSNFVEAACFSLKWALQEMDYNQSNQAGAAMDNIGLKERDSLGSIEMALKSLRLDLLSALEEADTLKIDMSGHNTDPSIIDFNGDCYFQDASGNTIGHASAHLHLSDAQEDPVWGSNVLSLTTSVGENCKSFKMNAVEDLLPIN